jgi:hypothetical protein
MIFHFKEKRRVKRQMEKELKFKFGVGENEPEQFDLKKELKRFGLRPNRRFKIVIDETGDPYIRKNVCYYVDTDNMLYFDNDFGGLMSGCDINDFVVYLVNGLVKIGFLDGLDE